MDDEDLVQPGFSVEDDIGDTESTNNSSYVVSENDRDNVSNEESQESDNNLQQRLERRKERDKSKHPYKERVARLANDNHIKDQINSSLQAQLAEKERLLSMREQELRNKEINNQNLFENNLRSEENSIVQGLRSAKEDGDIDKEIELQRDLARVKSEQAAFDVLKIQQNYQSQYEQANDLDTTFYPSVNPYSYDQYEEAPELSDEFVEFAERNPWVNPNAQEFSPELSQEADTIAAEFNKRLKFNNQSHLIGTDEYYSAIENVMRDSYSLKSQNQHQQQQQRTYTPSVGGVSRQGASMADQYMSRTNSGSRSSAIPLTPQEYKIARNLQVPDPMSPGKYLSHDKVVGMYAEAKQFYNKQPADSRYRITID